MAIKENIKLCSKCQERKPVTEFSKWRRSNDGLHPWCKICASAYKRKYRQTEKGKEVLHKYRQTEKYKEIHRRHKRKYYQAPNHKAALCAAARKRRRKYPDRMKARGAIKRAVKTGKILPVGLFRCVYCGREAAFYHHWHGYDKEHWLDVVPACRKCDSEQHASIIKLHTA